MLKALFCLTLLLVLCGCSRLSIPLTLSSEALTPVEAPKPPTEKPVTLDDLMRVYIDTYKAWLDNRQKLVNAKATVEAYKK